MGTFDDCLGKKGEAKASQGASLRSPYCPDLRSKHQAPVFLFLLLLLTFAAKSET